MSHKCTWCRGRGRQSGPHRQHRTIEQMQREVAEKIAKHPEKRPHIIQKVALFRRFPTRDVIEVADDGLIKGKYSGEEGIS